MILARVAVAKSSRSAASSADLSGTFYRACRKTAPRTGAVSSLSDLCSPHDAYAPCPLLAEQRLASHRLRQVATLLSELLPMGGAQNAGTVRNRTLRVSQEVVQRHSTGTAKRSMAQAASPVVVGLDGGSVRSRHRPERHVE